MDRRELMAGVPIHNFDAWMHADSPQYAQSFEQLGTNSDSRIASAQAEGEGGGSQNHPPVGLGTTKLIDRHIVASIQAIDFGFSDPADSPANQLFSIVVSSLPSSTFGELQLAETSVQLNQEIPRSLIPYLTFKPNPNLTENVLANFEFYVRDDGGTQNGGVDLSQDDSVLYLDIRDFNQPPSGTDARIFVREDDQYVFGAADFGFSDGYDFPPNTLASIKIDSLPNAAIGELQYSGLTIVPGIEIPSNMLSQLVFKPKVNFHGSDLAGFDFQVRDNGSNGIGDNPLDPTPNAISFNIQSVNDPPLGTDAVKALRNGTTYTFQLNNFGFSDPFEGDSLKSIRIESLPPIEDGVLRIRGARVKVGDEIPVGVISKFTFTPETTKLGAFSTSFLFRVRDDGGVAFGGQDFALSSNSFTFNVSSVEGGPAPSRTPIARLVKDIFEGSTASMPSWLTDVNETLYFVASDNDHQNELWKSDGTNSGTVLVKDLVLNGSSSPAWLTNLNGTLIFTISRPTGGSELWRSDGTEVGTSLIQSFPWNSGYSSLSSLVNFNGKLFFRATTPDGDSELWTSDGTANGTALFKNINANGSSNPLGLTVVDNNLFFSATTEAGRELWRSDGNVTGTMMVFDLGETYTPDGNQGYDEYYNPIPYGPVNTSSYPTELTNVSGTLFFKATTRSLGTELWKSNGSTIELVRDIVQEQDSYGNGYSSDPSQLTNVNGTLYFTAFDAGIGLELWKSNGTVSGTVAVKDIAPNYYDGYYDVVGSSSPSRLTNVNGRLYFNAYTPEDGLQIWSSDGTDNGTSILTPESNPGLGSTFPEEMVVINETFYFPFHRSDTGVELWKMVPNHSPRGASGSRSLFNGTDYIFRPSDFNFYDPLDSNAFYRVRISTLPENDRGTLLLQVNSGANQVPIDLPVSIGQEIPVGLIPQLRFRPNSNRANSFSASFKFQVRDDSGTALGGVDLDLTPNTFVLNVSVAPNSANNVPSSSSPRIALVKDIFSGTGSSEPSWLTEVNGVVYFSASDSVAGSELWKSDGTKSGTSRVKNISLDGGSNPSWLINFNGTLFFTVSRPTGGSELWRSNGSSGGTFRVLEFPAAEGVDSLSHLVSFKGQLYFSAIDANGDQELWRSDGTSTGTARFVDIDPVGNSWPSELTVVGETLYFVASTQAIGRELWKTDGNVAGTMFVRDIAENRTGYSYQYDEYGYQLPNAVPYTIVEGSYPSGLTNVSGTLYFVASTRAEGQELWKATGNSAQIVRNIVGEQDSYGNGYGSQPTSLTNVGGVLFFTATTYNGEMELWKSDGTDSGTIIVKDINPSYEYGSYGSSNPTRLTNVNGTLYFEAYNPDDGIKIWTSDGTPSGTFRLAEGMNPGFGARLPNNLLRANGMYLFPLEMEGSGIELFGMVPNREPSVAPIERSTKRGVNYAFKTADFELIDVDSPKQFLKSIVIESSPPATLGFLYLQVSPSNIISVLPGMEIPFASIDKLLFSPNSFTVGDQIGSFDYRVRDNGGVAMGGVDLAVNSSQFSFKVLAPSHAPSGVNATRMIQANGTYSFRQSDFAISDSLDTPNNRLKSIIISTLPDAQFGVLSLSGVVVIAGQEILSDAIQYLQFARALGAPASNPQSSNPISFQFRIRDDGGTALGGDDLSLEPANFLLHDLGESFVNHPPSGNSTTKDIVLNSLYAFSTSDFGFTDAFDRNSQLHSVVFTTIPRPDHGVLFVDQDNNGEITAGSTEQLTAGDTVIELNISKLRFKPASNFLGISVGSFTFQVRDNGGTTNGGVDLDPYPKRFAFNINQVAVNHPPIAKSSIFSIVKNSTFAFTVANFEFDDPNDFPKNGFKSIIIQSLPDPAQGTLKLNGAEVEFGKVISTDANAPFSISNLVFTAKSGFLGNEAGAFYFSVVDDGGTGYGGSDTSSNSYRIAFNIFDPATVNERPTGSDSSQILYRGSVFRFQVGDFGFSDAGQLPAPENHFKSVVIVQLPNPVVGQLTFDGMVVQPNQEILIDSISKLVFVPNSTASNNAITSFAFRVSDDGGGQDTALSPNTLSFTIKAVNTPPTVEISNQVLLEDSPSTWVSIAVSDLESLNRDLTYRIYSSNTALLDAQQIVVRDMSLVGVPATMQILLTPKPNQYGSSVLTLVVSDGHAETERTFSVLVMPVNDRPTVPSFVKTAIAAYGTRVQLNWTELGYDDVDGIAIPEFFLVEPPKATNPSTGIASIAYGMLQLGADPTDSGSQPIPIVIGIHYSKSLIDQRGLYFVLPSTSTTPIPGAVRFVYRGFDGALESERAIGILQFKTQNLTSDSLSIRLLHDPNDDGGGEEPAPVNDPTLIGWLNGLVQESDQIRVDFYHGEVGNTASVTPSGSIVLSSSDQSFVYDPRSFDPTFGTQSGTQTVTKKISYRLVHTSYSNGTATTSVFGWKLLTLFDLPAKSISLTGFSFQPNADQNQNGLLSGVAEVAVGTGAFIPTKMTVEFSRDDTFLNTSSFSTDEDGQFLFQLPNGTVLSSGIVYVRGRWWDDSARGVRIGAWQSVTLDSPPSIVFPEMSLAIDSSHRIAGDVALAGIAPHRVLVELKVNAGTPHEIVERVGIAPNGYYSFEIPHLIAGNNLVVGRVVIWDRITSNWISSTVSYNGAFTYSPPALPGFNPAIHLLNDTGTTNDRQSTDVTLSGQLMGNADLNDINIEFRFNGETDRIRATIQPASDRTFLYSPPISVNNWTLIEARVTRWNQLLNVTEYGPWSGNSFLRLPLASPLIVIANLRLVEDDGGDSHDRKSTRIAIQGNAAKSGKAEATRIQWGQFDTLTNNIVIKGEVVSNAQGDFTISPPYLSLGAHTLYFRGLSRNTLSQNLEPGAWSSFEFERLPTIAKPAPIITERRLLSDSGIDGDNITRNPTVVGRVTNADTVSGLPVEIDLDGDLTPDATVFTGIDGTFIYSPSISQPGVKVFNLRVSEYNSVAQAQNYSSWSPITFTLASSADQPDIAPLVKDIVFDDFAIDIDSRLQVPILKGRITNEGSVAGKWIEFDLTNNPILIDWTTTTDDYGRFVVALSGLPTGNHSIVIRTRETGEFTKEQLVGTTTISITHVAQSELSPSAPTIRLTSDDGVSGSDHVTSDSRIEGDVANDLQFENTIVEIDFDHDSYPDSVAAVSTSGMWSTAPNGLVAGQNSIKVRSRTVTSSGQIIRSPWSAPLTFELLASPTQSLQISNIGLTTDNGFPNDRVTSIPTISGSVIGRNSNQPAVISFDHDGDGRIDGTTNIAANNTFSYSPAGLSHDAWISIQARPSFENAVDGGGWVGFDFVFATDPNSENALQKARLIVEFEQVKLDTINAGTDARLARIAEDRLSDSQRETSSNDANAERNSLLLASQQALSESRQVANENLTLALNQASSAFALSMQSFVGNSQSFTFNALSVPDSPHYGLLQIPDDSSLTQPPTSIPTYSGPSLNIDDDDDFKTAKQAAEDAFDSVVRNSARVRQVSDNAANVKFQNAISQSAAVKKSELDRAKAGFDNALTVALSNDLSIAQNLYSAAIAHAEEKYEARRVAIENELVAILDWADLNHPDDDVERLNGLDDAYKVMVNASATAYTLYRDAPPEDVDPDSAEYRAQLESLLLANLSDHVAAQNFRGSAIANYDHDWFLARHTEFLTNALKGFENVRDYKIEKSEAVETYSVAIAKHHQEKRIREISATSVRDLAIAVIEQDHKNRVAAALKERDISLATSASTETLAVETARADMVLAIATFRKATAESIRQNEEASEGSVSHWTEYQVKLEQNEYKLQVEVNKVDKAYWGEITNKQLGRDLSDIDSKEDRDLAVAKSQYDNAVRHDDAQTEYWTSFSDATFELETKQARSLYLFESGFAKAEHKYSVDSNTLRFQSASAALDLELNDALDRLSALEPFLPYEALIVRLAAVFDRVLHTKQHPITVSHLTQQFKLQWKFDLDDAKTHLGLHTSTSNQDAKYSLEINSALLEYQSATAASDWLESVEISDANRTLTKATSAHQLAYVLATGPKEKERTDKKRSHEQEKSVADVEAWKTFLKDEATDYRDAIGAWNASVATPWSNYHFNLATIEYDRAISAGNNAVAYVKKMQIAVNRQGLSASAAALKLSIDLERADKKFQDDVADAKHAYVASDAYFNFAYDTAKETYRYTALEIDPTKDSLLSLTLRVRNDDYQFGADRWIDFLDASYRQQIDQDVLSADTETAFQLIDDDVNAAFAIGYSYVFATPDSSWHFWVWAVRDDLTYPQQRAIMDAAEADKKSLVEAAALSYRNIQRTASFAVYDIGRQRSFRELSHQQRVDADFAKVDLNHITRKAQIANNFADEKFAIASTLAEDLRSARVNLETEDITAGLKYDKSNVVADQTFIVDSVKAQGNRSENELIADLARRENTIAARGIYEVALYQADAQSKTLGKTTLTRTALENLEYEAATAQAVKANALRIVRDSYEDEISASQLAQLRSTNAANLKRAYDVKTTEIQYMTSSFPIELDHGESIARANAQMTKASTIADAQLAKDDEYANSEFSVNRELAIQGMKDSNAQLAESFARLTSDTNFRYIKSVWGSTYNEEEDELENSELTETLKAARTEYLTSLSTAFELHISAINHANVLLVSKRGQAQVDLATHRGDAGYHFADSVATADNTYQSDISATRLTRVTSIAGADADLNKNIAAIQVTFVQSSETAVVNRIYRAPASGQSEWSANTNYASSLALADMHFFVANATSEQNLALTAAILPTGTSQDGFNSLYFASKVNWLNDISSAYIQQHVDYASADSMLEYNLAATHQTLSVNRAVEERKYVDLESSKTILLKQNLAKDANTRDISLTKIDGERRIDKSKHTKTYEIDIATAEMNYATALAILKNPTGILPGAADAAALAQFTDDDFAFYIENRVDYFDEEQKIPLTDAEKAPWLSIRNAELKVAKHKWQLAENKGREEYTIGDSSNPLAISGLAQIEQTYSVDVAGHQQGYAKAINALAETRDKAFTTLQIVAWSSEVGFKNAHRTYKGLSDLGFWSVRESQRVIAHQYIDTAMATPWSEYLVYAANARVAAFNALTPVYSDLIDSRNSSELLHQTQLSNGYRIREDALTEARKLNSDQSADAAKMAAVARASAEAAYLEGVAPVAKAFLDKQVALLANDLTTESEFEANKLAFYADEAEVFTARYVAIAKLDYDLASATLDADRSLLKSKSTSERDYREVESKAYVASITRWSGFDKYFAMAHASTMATAAANAATSAATVFPLPWLQYDADVLAAQSNFVQLTEPAAHQYRVDVATIQSTFEIKLATSESTDEKAKVNSSYKQGDSNAKSNEALAKRDAERILELAKNGTYSTALPELNRLGQVEYKILQNRTSYSKVTGPTLYDILPGWINLDSGCCVRSEVELDLIALPQLRQINLTTPVDTEAKDYTEYKPDFNPNRNVACKASHERYKVVERDFFDLESIIASISDERYSQTELYGTQFSDYNIYTFSEPTLPANIGSKRTEITSTPTTSPPLGTARSQTLPFSLVAPINAGDATEANNLAASSNHLPSVSVSDGSDYDAEAVRNILQSLDAQLDEFVAKNVLIVGTKIEKRPSLYPFDANTSSYESSSATGGSTGAELLGTVVEKGLNRHIVSKPAAFNTVVVEAKSGTSSYKVATDAAGKVVKQAAEVGMRKAGYLDSEIVFIEKLNKLLSDGVQIDAKSVGDFATGVYHGFIDGVQDGLLGMAVKGGVYVVNHFGELAYGAGKFAYHATQLRPEIRYPVKWVTGYDIGANEEAVILKSLQPVLEVVTEIISVYEKSRDDFIRAILTNDRAYFDELTGKLSFAAVETLHVARLILSEVGKAILDSTPEQAGKLIGLLLYEAVESGAMVILEALLTTGTLGTAGSAAPVTVPAGAALIGARAAAITRFIAKIEKWPGMDVPLVARAIERLVELSVWMNKFPVCFVAGTKIHTDQGLKNIEDIRPGDMVLSRSENAPNSTNRYQRVVELFETHPTRLYKL
ncbi:MAG: hypothetical protein SGI77_21425, partial [Pirellulaceae bacterium]|nr:hypothetical protein [Pirellulaceae bacterium]